MGNIILCSGKKAVNPFYFGLSNTNVYTIEELCYYIYQNIYIIGDELYQQELANWLINEVDMKDIGLKLSEFIRNKHSMKDIVVSILCSADYYTEKEIKDLIAVMDEIELLSPIRKQKLKADKYLNYRNYKYAIGQYKQILRSKDAAVFTKEEYGDIEHNLAIGYLFTSSYHDAANHFLGAYKRNDKKKSLIQYLYALNLGEYKEEFEKAIVEYNVTDSQVSEIHESIKEAFDKAEGALEYKEITHLKEQKEIGKVNEYYDKIDEILKSLKDEYRKSI